ncbi:MAG TPA: flagellar basal body L-ring protein FlgH [Allosphingosinicella sp.]|nr:flagellar basal body L-ring protein FlgH [Allosphingosinicella sp.]
MAATALACLAALAAIPAGATPVRTDFAAAPCSAEVRPALRYEPATGAVRAVRDIAAGETIAAPPASALPDVRAGAPLYLVARAGTALVERAVTAAQPGRAGQPIFVRTPEGRVFAAALSDDLYRQDNWAALASDRRASAVGDILTVVVLENSTAAHSAQIGTRRGNRLSGDISAGTALNESATLGLSGQFDGTGQMSRSGRMIAQISVRVDQVYPNGDLGISGAQVLNISGERTNIRIRGRVRPADIAGNNTVPSARIAEAVIDYDGTGFVSRSARPGLVQRIFRFLGLM